MPEIDESWVRHRAHEIWEKQGRPEGKDFDHWCAAMEEFRAQKTTEPSTPPEKSRAGTAVNPRKTKSKPVAALNAATREG